MAMSRARWCRRGGSAATSGSPSLSATARWFVDETYVKVVGSWRYVYGAIDEYRPVIDVQISRRRDITAAWRTSSPS